MRRQLLAAGFGVLMAMMLATPASAQSIPTQWHRINPATTTQAAEHERQTCAFPHKAAVCAYFKAHSPGYHWDSTVGLYRGHKTTSSWTCPNWFPTTICDNVVKVYSGWSVYVPAKSGPVLFSLDYIFTNVNGVPILQLYWRDQGFVCPWYTSFAAAKAANPSGTMDCVFAPVA